MYKAIGDKTKVIVAYADTKTDLMRKLNENYPFKAMAEAIYEEPLKIVKEGETE